MRKGTATDGTVRNAFSYRFDRYLTESYFFVNDT
jgi:hypothetical protein